ncbi:hypothetical protein CZP2022_62 [Vibrio phage C-ZP2022]|nr:hypothetical protein CZP2022_62 [Vibrio phage C-ZP2022]
MEMKDYIGIGMLFIIFAVFALGYILRKSGANVDKNHAEMNKDAQKSLDKIEATKDANYAYIRRVLDEHIVNLEHGKELFMELINISGVRDMCLSSAFQKNEMYIFEDDGVFVARLRCAEKEHIGELFAILFYLHQFTTIKLFFHKSKASNNDGWNLATWEKTMQEMLWELGDICLVDFEKKIQDKRACSFYHFVPDNIKSPVPMEIHHELFVQTTLPPRYVAHAITMEYQGTPSPEEMATYFIADYSAKKIHKRTPLTIEVDFQQDGEVHVIPLADGTKDEYLIDDNDDVRVLIPSTSEFGERLSTYMEDTASEYFAVPHHNTMLSRPIRRPWNSVVYTPADKDVLFSITEDKVLERCVRAEELLDLNQLVTGVLPDGKQFYIKEVVPAYVKIMGEETNSYAFIGTLGEQHPVAEVRIAGEE